MHKSLVRKGLVIGIIILFIGASGVSGANRRINDLSNDITEILDDVEDTVDVIEEQVVSDGSRQPLDSGFWWNPDWLYRKQTTINHNLVDDNLTNFPVLVSNISLDFADHAQPDGDDFVFTNHLGTILNHEIESYNEITGKLIAWANVDYLSSIEDTNIWLYYGNENCDNQQNVSGVFDENYVGVWHMDEEPTYDQLDSSSYNNYAYFVNEGTDNTLVSGMIGDCIQFNNGHDHYVTNPDDSLNTGSEFTFGAWIQVNDFHNYEEWFIKGNDWYILTREDGSINKINCYAGNKNVKYIEGNDDVWYYVVNTANPSGNLRLYIDGRETDVVTGGSWTDNTPVVGIGKIRHSGRQPDGLLDEARLSNIARSPEWINASYNTINNPELFISVGDEQFYPSIVYVDDDYNETTPGWGYDYFDSIQDGIDAVEEGGTVYVYSGSYIEDIEITKSLNLLGENMSTTFIEPDTWYQMNIMGYPDPNVINELEFSGFTLIDTMLDIRRVNNSLIHNIIIDNDGTNGRCMFVSNDLTNCIFRNITFKNATQKGIWIWDDNNVGNLFYHNNFIVNSINVVDEGGNNFWDNGYLSGGNYWDDYDGVDEDGNRIGDTPYTFSGGEDLYPLMYPWDEMPPVADFSYEIDDISVTFDASESYDRDGTIITYVWDFGDGAYDTGLGVTHPFLEYGEFSVILTVFDDDGYTGNITKIIDVEDFILPEIVDNTISTGYTGDSFIFEAVITDYAGISSAWVEYWYGSGDHMNESMTNTAGDIWEKTITIDDTLETLHYFISAYDSSNWNSSEQGDVSIFDNDDPEINDINVNPEVQIIGENVNITAIITDNIEIQNVLIYMRYPDTYEEDIDITQNKIGDTYFVKLRARTTSQ